MSQRLSKTRALLKGLPQCLSFAVALETQKFNLWCCSNKENCKFTSFFFVWVQSLKRPAEKGREWDSLSKMSSENLFAVLGKLWQEYQSKTPQRLKLVDAYLAYIMVTGIIQFLYCLLVGTFPFNSFLSGFISCVGSFVLTGKCNSN